MSRVCRKCGVEKPASEFLKYADGKPRARCIECNRFAQREYSRDYARRKREAEKLERDARKLEELEANKGRLLIGQMAQDQFRDFLNKILDDREVNVEDLLS